jgi:hypothetical protein
MTQLPVVFPDTLLRYTSFEQREINHPSRVFKMEDLYLRNHFSSRTLLASYNINCMTGYLQRATVSPTLSTHYMRLHIRITRDTFGTPSIEWYHRDVHSAPDRVFTLTMNLRQFYHLYHLLMNKDRRREETDLQSRGLAARWVSKEDIEKIGCSEPSHAPYLFIRYSMPNDSDDKEYLKYLDHLRYTLNNTSTMGWTFPEGIILCTEQVNFFTTFMEDIYNRVLATDITQMVKDQDTCCFHQNQLDHCFHCFHQLSYLTE